MDTDLDPDYLTPEFLQMFAYTLREAADRGMQMMLYDEDGGPSGAAGGRVVRGHAELCGAKLTADGQIEPLSGPDRMNRAAVERFTALTHSAYAATDGIRPGQNIGATFTDEPALPYPAWTPDLATEFPAQYGYDIREFAPALYDSDAMGEPGKQARIDYFDWMSRRYAESYFGTLRDWCRAHRMLSAGHANGEDCVLRLHPDLVVVCYGLNDAGRAAAGLDDYCAALHQIFAKIHPSGAEVIFLTPNLHVTHPQRPFRNPVLDDVAASVAENERAGWLARYLDGARAICQADGVPVCDCNALWTTMQAAGVDTDELLANRVNHPTPALHGMFAYELVKTMFLS